MGNCLKRRAAVAPIDEDHEKQTTLKEAEEGGIIGMKTNTQAGPPAPPVIGPALALKPNWERPLLLSAYIGGTSSRVCLFHLPKGALQEKEEGRNAEAGKEDIVYEANFANAAFETCALMLGAFLSEARLAHADALAPPLLACLAVAGVVVDNSTKMVNLGWYIDGAQLSRDFGIHHVALINDYVAQGYGVLTLQVDHDCDVIQRAAPQPRAPKVVLGPGTGFGEAFLTVGKGDEYDVWPGEGGHVEFAPRQEGKSMLQFEMLQYLQIKFTARARISVERVVSGRGLSNVYEFLTWKFPEKVVQAVRQRWLGPRDKPRAFDASVVCDAARTKESELCQQAVELFMSAYGSEAGVLALQYLPFGGIFLTGGVTAKMRDFLTDWDKSHVFLDAFLDKGRVSHILEKIPVYLVRKEDLGERGAKLKVQRMLQEELDTQWAARELACLHPAMLLDEPVDADGLREARADSGPGELPKSPAQLPLLMSADVGGTSSRLKLFTPASAMGTDIDLVVPERRIVFQRQYRNAFFESFQDVVEQFLRDATESDGGKSRTGRVVPVAGCIAVAGVVMDNKVRFVNLGWEVSGAALENHFGIDRVVLINDFEAQGFGVLTLDHGTDVDVLQDAPVLPGAPMAVIGPGTGLGEAYLTRGEDGDYEVWPSEGGHAEFAPRQDGSSAIQFEMLQYLQIKYSAKARISVERVVSGTGISNTYEFLAWRHPEKVNDEVHHRWIGPPDERRRFDAAVVAQAAASGECELCRRAMEIFVGAFGAEVGVVALTYMPFGGLYLTGGVTSKTKDFILGVKGEKERFLEALLDKGRISDMLERIPVFIVRGEDLGERGAMLKAQRVFQEVAESRWPKVGDALQLPDQPSTRLRSKALVDTKAGQTMPEPNSMEIVAPPRDVPAGAPIILSADVGGTSSRLHLILPPGSDETSDGVVPAERKIFEAKFTNRFYESFSGVMRDFLAASGAAQPPVLACLAVAGAVVNAKARFVNLGWCLDARALEKEFNIASVALMNDFEAQGYGVLTLDASKDCEVLQDAPVKPRAPIAILGAGTGLGEAFLSWGPGGRYEVWPSEGGHAEFAPRQDGGSDLQMEMLSYLQIKYSARSRVSVERVVSGRGLANIYEFLAWRFPERVDRATHRKFVEADSRGEAPRAVSEAASAGDAMSIEAVDIFVGSYGSEAGVLALTFLPLGGVYLTGGVTAKLADWIAGRKGAPEQFLEAFRDKGRLSDTLRGVPVFLVKGEDMGERGAMVKAMRLFRESLLPGVRDNPGVPVDPEAPPESPAPPTGEVLLLSADVGGTSSRLRLFEPPGVAGNVVVPRENIAYEEKFANVRFESFADVVQVFLDNSGRTAAPVLACLAVAGVVVNNRAKFVNLGWVVDGEELSKRFGIEAVVLINDFEAQGYGVLTLDKSVDCITLQDAAPVHGAPQAVIGPGTGLGEAWMTVGESGDYEVWPTEGGHAEFAPRQDGASKVQYDMLKYLQIKFSAQARISVERVVSGRGISNIYEFLSWKFPKEVNKDVHRKWRSRTDSIEMNPAVITVSANDGTSELAQKAVDIFIGAYGAEAGVLALKYMPFGGLYLTGGVSCKLSKLIADPSQPGKQGRFLTAFLDKGRVSHMLKRIPVYLVKEEDMGERGSMLKAIRLYRARQAMEQ